MEHLGIFLEEPLTFARIDNGLSEVLHAHGSIYYKRPTLPGEIVFYDWIIDETDMIRGLEVHLPAGDPLFQSAIPLKSLSFVDTDCFVRVWFGKNRLGSPGGLEAFGDLTFFATENGRLAIA